MIKIGLQRWRGIFWLRPSTWRGKSYLHIAWAHMAFVKTYCNTGGAQTYDIHVSCDTYWRGVFMCGSKAAFWSQGLEHSSPCIFSRRQVKQKGQEQMPTHIPARRRPQHFGQMGMSIALPTTSFRVMSSRQESGQMGLSKALPTTSFRVTSSRQEISRCRLISRREADRSIVATARLSRTVRKKYIATRCSFLGDFVNSKVKMKLSSLRRPIFMLS